MSCPEFRRVR
ncbi:hypothetical protein SLYA8N_37535 [Streptomyces lividans]